MYIRRDLFEHIGLFDEKAFPRGYGEENDFCLRAVKAGWKNFITPHAYVFHQRSASFGNEKHNLMVNAMNVLRQRYPHYERSIKAAWGSDPMKALRAQVSQTYEQDPTISILPKLESPDSVPASGKHGYTPKPEMRFYSLGKTMINWIDLRSKLPLRNHELVSVILCVYNQPELTEKCLLALTLNTPNYIHIEIIVVNNGSNKETSDLLSKWSKRDKRIVLINNFDNLNFSLGNNIGFAASRGNRIVFINNDTEVTSGWLPPLLNAISSPEIKGAQPKLLYPDGRIQCIGVVFSGKTPLGYPIYADTPGNSKLVSRNRRFRAITAACMAIRDF